MRANIQEPDLQCAISHRFCLLISQTERSYVSSRFFGASLTECFSDFSFDTGFKAI